MNILSLFDGMSCGQLALERSGIPINNYFASEIDKYAIAVTQYHYPNTIQLGDVNNWIDWNLPKIDLLIGGSPCQGFSKAGQGFNFSDPRSQLFFKYVDCLKWYKPTWFLLENVVMKKEWQDIISNILEVEPIMVDSALVSAQSRKRLYWSNISIEQPVDKKLYLKDIVENGEVDREKSYCIDANYYKGGSLNNYLKKKRRQIDNLPPMHQSEKRLMVRTVPHGYMKEEIKEREKYSSLAAQDPSSKYLIRAGSADIKGHDYNRRVYSIDGKSPTLNAHGGGNSEPKITEDYITWRKLTPLECERLQTVPDNWTLVPFGKRMMSNTQRYKMLGNGWTIDVIAHIFRNIFDNY